MKTIVGLALIGLILEVAFIDHSLPWRLALVALASAVFTWDIFIRAS